MSEVEYDDLLYAETDRWVREIEKSNWAPTSQAPSIFPDGQTRNMSELLGDALDTYKECRRQYSASLLAFPRLQKNLKEANQERERLDNTPKINPDGSFSVEELDEWFWEGLRRQSIETDYEKVVKSFGSLRQKKREAARAFIRILEMAKMSGAIKNEGLSRRLSQCEIDFRQLSSDYKTLLEKNKRLEEERDFASGHVHRPNQPPKPP